MVSRTASEISGSSFSIHFLDNLITEYVSTRGLFTDYFMKLGSRYEFQKFADLAIENIEIHPKQLGEGLKKKKHRPKSWKKRKFLDNLIKDISHIEPRLGYYLKDKILTVLNNNIDTYDPPSYSKEFLLNRTISKEEIISTYKSQNNVDLIKNELVIANSEIEKIDSLPGSIIIQSDLDSKTVSFEYMQEIIFNAIKQSNFEDDPNFDTHSVYLSIVNSFEKWILFKNHEKSKDAQSEIYRDFKELVETLGEVFGIKKTPSTSSIAETSVEEKELLKLEQTRINSIQKNIRIAVDKDKIKDIIDTFNNLRKSKYQGKSFPIFPGQIDYERLTLLPPTLTQELQKQMENNNINELLDQYSEKIFQNYYMVRAIGDGWKKENNLENILHIGHILNDIQENYLEIYESADMFEQLQKKYNDFIIHLGMDDEQINYHNFVKLQQIIKKSGDPKRLYVKITELISNDDKYHIFQLTETKDITKIKIKSNHRGFERKQRVLFLINDYSRPDYDNFTRLRYLSRNIIPEFTLSLLSNAGIWAKSIEVYTCNLDMKINSDDKWDMKQNKSLLRWLKSTIDSIILDILLKGEVQLTFANNPFKKLENDENLLIIPILNRFGDNKGKSNIHKYYYEILEGIMALGGLELDNNIDTDYYPISRINFKQKSKDRNRFHEMLDNYFQVKTYERYKNMEEVRNLGNSINIQNFDNIPTISDLDEIYPLLSNFESENYVNSILDGFNKSANKEFERKTVYELDPEFYNNKHIPKSFSLISYIPKNKNEKIIPDLFFLLKLLNLGRTKNKTFLDKVLKPFLDNSEHPDDFLSILHEYFSDDDIKMSITKLIGGFVRPDFIFGYLLNASSSLRRTEGNGFRYVLDSNSEISDLQAVGKDFFTVLVESHPIKSQSSDDQENIFRVLVIHYTGNQVPKFVLNEYFLNSRDKDTTNYRIFIEDIIFKIIYKTDKYAFSRIKNTARSGEYLALKTNKTLSESAWGYFSHLSQNYIKELKNSAKMKPPKIWGYVKNFMSFPQVNFLAKTDPRILNHDFTAVFQTGDFIHNNEYNILNCNVILLIKPQSSGMNNLASKNKQREEEKNLKSKGMYASGNALINFRHNSIKYTNEIYENAKSLVTVGSLTGDEIGDISLAGFERLFYYPNPDEGRVIFTPSFLIQGVDFFLYKE